MRGLRSPGGVRPGYDGAGAARTAGTGSELAGAGREVREHCVRRSWRRCPASRAASVGAHAFVCPKLRRPHRERRAGASAASSARAPLVVDAAAIELIAPEAVLPFAVDRAGVRTALRAVVPSRWFAPTSLKKVSEAETLKGTYLPHWTFDGGPSRTTVGQRGEHYWDTETYTVTVDGRQRRETRQVQQHPVVPGERHGPPRLRRRAGARHRPAAPTSNWTSSTRGRWPEAVAYQPDYLAGYHAAAVRHRARGGAGRGEGADGAGHRAGLPGRHRR